MTKDQVLREHSAASLYGIEHQPEREHVPADVFASTAHYIGGTTGTSISGVIKNNSAFTGFSVDCPAGNVFDSNS